MAKNTLLHRFSQPLVLVWDDGCQFCARSRRSIKALDWLGRVTAVGKSQVGTVPAEWVEGYTEAAINEGMFVRALCTTAHHHSKAYYGFYALRRLSWALPLGWLAMPLLYLPGVPWLGEKAYGWIARNRQKLGGCSDSCEIR